VAEAPPPSDLDREEREEREAVAVAETVVSAERLIRNEDYWDAIRQLEGVMPRTQGRLRARVRVSLARAYLANPKWRHRAQETLRQAIKEQPKYVESYVVLGHVYRAQDFLGRAAAMYRKALELRPDHDEALAALVSLESTTKSPSMTEALKKFFKKS
jgi:cytochrome c-type biogenesis protein CcmH/NrfG